MTWTIKVIKMIEMTEMTRVIKVIKMIEIGRVTNDHQRRGFQPPVECWEYLEPVRLAVSKHLASENQLPSEEFHQHLEIDGKW